jgi:hypothetical protein
MVIVRWEIRVRNLAGISPPATKTIVPAQRTNISSKHENSIHLARVQTKLLLLMIQNLILHQYILHGTTYSVITAITKWHENVSQLKTCNMSVTITMPKKKIRWKWMVISFDPYEVHYNGHVNKHMWCNCTEWSFCTKYFHVGCNVVLKIYNTWG